MRKPVAPPPKLNHPPKTGWWRLKHRLMDPEDRRSAFCRAVCASDLEMDERLSQMRTLIDLDLWSDLPSEDSAELGFWASLLQPADLRKLSLGYEQNERNSINRLFPHAINKNTPTALLELLIEAGMDLEAKYLGEYSDTPLLSAIRLGLPDHASLLLQAGADMSAKDSCGDTALSLAVAHFHKAQSTRPPAEDLVELLLSGGADPNSMIGASWDKPTPLLWRAAATFHPPIVERLLQAGASLKVDNDVPCGVLSYVMTNSMTADWTDGMAASFRVTVEKLLDNGLDINQDSVLLQAISRRYTRATAILADLGADICVRDQSGMGIPHHLVLGFEPSDPICEDLMARLPDHCWGWIDAQGKTPLDILAYRIEEHESQGWDDYDGGPWSSFFSGRTLEATTAASLSDRCRPRL